MPDTTGTETSDGNNFELLAIQGDNKAWIRYKQEIELRVGFHQIRVQGTCNHYKSTYEQSFRDAWYTTRRFYQHSLRPTECSETVFIRPKPDAWKRSEVLCHVGETELELQEGTATSSKEMYRGHGRSSLHSNGICLPPEKNIPRIVLRRRHSQPDFELMRDKFVHPEDRYARRRSLGTRQPQPPLRVSRMQGALQTWQEMEGCPDTDTDPTRRPSTSVQYAQQPWRRSSTNLHEQVETNYPTWRSSQSTNSCNGLGTSEHGAASMTEGVFEDQGETEGIEESGPGTFFRQLSVQTAREMEEEDTNNNKLRRKSSVGQKRNSFWVMDAEI